MQQNKSSIRVRFIQECGDIKLDAVGLAKMVRRLCPRFGVRKATLSIAIVGDDEIRRINTRFLGRRRSTDVISFDLSDGAETGKVFELVVNAQKAQKEARLRHHDARSELALYIVHGLLHNLGFDDADEEQACKMHAVEDDILQEFGYGRVYTAGSGNL